MRRLRRRDAGRQGRRQIRFHGQLLFRTSQAGAQGVQGADAVGDGLPLAHHQLFAQQLGVFIAQPRQFQSLLEFHAQRRDIPRLLDVAVDLPLVDGFHRVLQLGIRGGQNAHDKAYRVPMRLATACRWRTISFSRSNWACSLRKRASSSACLSSMRSAAISHGFWM